MCKIILHIRFIFIILCKFILRILLSLYPDITFQAAIKTLSLVYRTKFPITEKIPGGLFLIYS